MSYSSFYREKALQNYDANSGKQSYTLVPSLECDDSAVLLMCVCARILFVEAINKYHNPDYSVCDLYSIKFFYVTLRTLQFRTSLYVTISSFDFMVSDSSYKNNGTSIIIDKSTVPTLGVALLVSSKPWTELT